MPGSSSNFIDVFATDVVKILAVGGGLEPLTPLVGSLIRFQGGAQPMPGSPTEIWR